MVDKAKNRDKWYENYNGKPFNVDELFKNLTGEYIKQRKLNILALNVYITELSSKKVSSDGIIKIIEKWIAEKGGPKFKSINMGKVILNLLVLLGNYVKDTYLIFEENVNKKNSIKLIKDQIDEEIEAINKMFSQIEKFKFFKVYLQYEENLDREIDEELGYIDYKITIHGNSILFYYGVKKLAEINKNQYNINLKDTYKLISDLFLALHIIGEKEYHNFVENLSRNINRIDKHKVQQILQFFSKKAPELDKTDFNE